MLHQMKHLVVVNELKKLQTFDSSPFISQSCFNNDGSKLLIIFQPIYKTVTIFFGLSDTISYWEPKGLSNEKIEPSLTVNKSLSRKLAWMDNFKIRLRFTGSY